MRRTLIVTGIIIVVALFGGVALLSVKNSNTSTSNNMLTPKEPTDPNQISIENFTFKQQKITIKKGTTVTWTNNDDAHHDITPTSGASDFVASKLLSTGEKYEFTFNQPGVYTYKCSPHPYMKGTVEVTE